MSDFIKLCFNCYNKSLMSLVSIYGAANRNSSSLFNSTMSESVTPCKKVLSIQSHVVHGYVGNKSATFPLQVLGFEVDAINSVQFSNHTGYEHIKGQILNEHDLADVFEGLCLNKLVGQYSHLLTGYIGNANFLRQISVIVKKMREVNPNLIYVCDPVMGDNGRMYVPKELLPIYRDEIIPLADIITPNQYEVELITGCKIRNEDDAWAAMKWFHDRNVKIVALSSTELGPEGELLAFLSQENGTKFTISIPKQGYGIDFTGTGDLFAALFLAHSHLNKDISKALEYTIASLQAVIKRTTEYMPEDVKSGKRKVTSRERELKLIQSKTDIEQPKVILKANPV